MKVGVEGLSVRESKGRGWGRDGWIREDCE